MTGYRPPPKRENVVAGGVAVVAGIVDLPYVGEGKPEFGIVAQCTIT
jgi:hypothetical protein